MIRFFTDNNRGMLMVYDTRVIPFIVKEIEKMETMNLPLKIYIFSDGAYPYVNDFGCVIDKVMLIPLPYAYHRAIKDTLPNETPIKVDENELTREEQIKMMNDAIEAENNENMEG